MHPVLFVLPGLGIAVPSYGVSIALGIVLAGLLTERRARAVGLPPGTVLDLGLIGVIAGLAGARLTAVLENLDYFASRGLLTVFALWEGGLTFYGGLILAMAALFLFARHKKLGRRATLDLLDLSAPALALAMAFGRLGCFLNGCCFGRPSSLPFPLAVAFPPGSPPHLHALGEAGWLDGDMALRGDRLAAAGLPEGTTVDTGTDVPRLVAEGILPPPEPLVATQLLEAAFCLALFAALYFAVWPRRTRPGQAAIVFLLVYPVGRFLLELVRGDNPALLGPLTISQLITIAVLVAAVGWTVARRRAPAPAESEAPPRPPRRRRRRR